MLDLETPPQGFQAEVRIRAKCRFLGAISDALSAFRILNPDYYYSFFNADLVNRIRVEDRERIGLHFEARIFSAGSTNQNWVAADLKDPTTLPPFFFPASFPWRSFFQTRLISPPPLRRLKRETTPRSILPTPGYRAPN